jgi:pyruvate formate lyase activating enzyme
MLRVHSIETFGTHEGPGIRLVVFLQGCNIKCVYCHNPDTQTVGIGKEMQTEEILELLEKEKPYFGKKGGITVSGGEPLLQRHGLYDLFSKAKEAGFHTTLDTNGTLIDDAAKKLLEVTDLVLLDVKHIDPTWHRKVTGGSNETVLRVAAHREQTNKPMWLRYVLVPGWTDHEEFLHQWGKHFESYKSVERVEILPYHTFGEYKYKELGREYALKGLLPPTHEGVQKAENIFKKYFKNVYIR